MLLKAAQVEVIEHAQSCIVSCRVSRTGMLEFWNIKQILDRSE